MRTPRYLVAMLVSLVLVAAYSSTTATPSSAPQTETPATTAPQTEMPASEAPSEPEAWTQSDIFQGFDPMSLDLTGYTPGAKLVSIRPPLPTSRTRRPTACSRSRTSISSWHS